MSVDSTKEGAYPREGSLSAQVRSGLIQALWGGGGPCPHVSVCLTWNFIIQHMRVRARELGPLALTAPQLPSDLAQGALGLLKAGHMRILRNGVHSEDGGSHRSGDHTGASPPPERVPRRKHPKCQALPGTRAAPLPLPIFFPGGGR